MTYEESVNWLRECHPDLAEGAYLEADNMAAALRFSASEEFADVTRILRLNQPKMKVLDVGGGNGIASFAFGALGHDVTILDPDPSDEVGLGAAARLAEKVQLAGGTLRLQPGFAEELPFPDASFDVVYTRQSVHHFANITVAMKECHRVLKPKGIFFATREHVVSGPEQLKQFLDGHILQAKHGGEHAFTLPEYIDAMTSAGFQKIQSYGQFDTPINFYPASCAEISSIVEERLSRRIGGRISKYLVSIPSVSSKLHKAMSSRCNEPGRLYSFFARV